MRLFVAIPLSNEVSHHLERLINHLRPSAQLSWSRVYNLHITTKFIGEVPPERLQEVIHKLEELTVLPQFELEVAGLGWFPNPHNPRVLFAAVSKSPGLLALAEAINAALETIGFERETKPLSPHITLARVRTNVPLATLKQSIAQLESVEFGSIPVRHFELYESEAGAAGTVYTSLADFPLQKALSA